MKYSNGKILLLGPYFGSWKEEIITFRPFVKYVSETVEHDKIIVSSHYNRSFLYDWADNFIPIERQFSEDEFKQKGFIHKDLEQKDYFKKSRQIKERICEKYEVTKKDILHYNVPYVKNQTAISVYQKSFTPILTNRERESLILYIPSSVENQNKVEDLYYRLKDQLDINIIGDRKCYLQRENILNVIDYIDSGYQYLMEYINSSKLIITPCSHWTYLANLQQVPVFSWGKFISPYKKNGAFNFGNTNMIVPTMENDKLVKQLLYFKETLSHE